MFRLRRKRQVGGHPGRSKIRTSAFAHPLLPRVLFLKSVCYDTARTEWIHHEK